MNRHDSTGYWSNTLGDTVGEILDRWAERKPDKEGLVQADRRFTWAEMAEATDSLATAFLDLGMKKGDRLGILGPNHPEMLLSWFAAAKVGIIPVPMSSRYRRKELEYIICDSALSTLITIDEFEGYDFLQALSEIRNRLPALRNVVVHKTREGSSEGLLLLGDLLGTQPDLTRIHENRPASSDILVILYTSGTTGSPKGVVHTHDSMFYDSKSYITEVHRLTDQDVLLQSMPWSHMVGHQNFNNTCLLLGQKNVLMDVYRPEKFIDLIEQERVTWLDGVPTMFLLPPSRVPDFAERDLSSVRFIVVCGFYCPPEQMREIRSRYNSADIIQMVGSTEGGSLLANRRDDQEETIFGTVGRPVSTKELRICDRGGKTVGPGEVGELLYRGPSIFQCYWNNPDLTRREKDEEGFWHSGDLGKTTDGAGNIRFMGRIKDVVIRGGFNIYPAEIEACILGLSSVKSAVMVGYPDPVLGEKTCCLVVPQESGKVSQEGIRKNCRAELADYKTPDMIRVVDELPLLPSGKVDRVRVKEDLLKEMGLSGLSTGG
ncbi:MAG: class I adenylate-forming enzyme family protein [Thermodesulfobacteriota bacterium]